MDGDTYLGRIQLRHRLTDHLRDFGGHIGYGIRPTARRRGHATAMLREVLTTNTASRKVIEAGGGEFEDERGGKSRYWIRTGG
jgi:predicted acetyltransferase